MKKCLPTLVLMGTVFLPPNVHASATWDFGHLAPLARHALLPMDYYQLTAENRQKYDTLFHTQHAPQFIRDIAAITPEDAVPLSQMDNDAQIHYIQKLRSRFAVAHGLCPDAGFDFTRHMGRFDLHTSLVMSVVDALKEHMTRSKAKSLPALDEEALKTLLSALHDVTPPMFALYSKKRRILFFKRFLETKDVDTAVLALLPREHMALIQGLSRRVRLRAAGVPPGTLLTCGVLEKIAPMQDEERALACLTFFMQPVVIKARTGAHYWQAQTTLSVPYLAWLPSMYMQVKENERHHLLTTLGKMDEGDRLAYENAPRKDRWAMIRARLPKNDGNN